jgi:hypothetical protein
MARSGTYGTKQNKVEDCRQWHSLLPELFVGNLLRPSVYTVTLIKDHSNPLFIHFFLHTMKHNFIAKQKNI